MTRVAKWGNSLALRLPAAVAGSVSMKAGDEVSVTRTADGGLLIRRDDGRAKALEAIRTLAKPLPAGFRFDRDEANRRGGSD